VYGYRIVCGTMTVASVVNCLLLLLLSSSDQKVAGSDHVGVTNMGGGIRPSIPPSH
jgi:hypothetical protein